jgi:hypothetical protein
MHNMHFRKERKLHIVWLPKVGIRNVQFRELYTRASLFVTNKTDYQQYISP